MSNSVEEKVISFEEKVISFYESFGMTDSNEAEIAEYAREFMDENWESTPNLHPAGKLGYEGMSEVLHGFHQIIPDLKWTVEQHWVAGDTVIIRGRAQGTPKGNFFGVETDGTKSFDIMSIDIHQVKDGKMVKSYHIEEWATAIQQVSK